MSIQISMFLLIICSTMTGLIVEAIKKMKGGINKINIVTAIVGTIVGVIIPVGYILYTGISFDVQNILAIISIAIFSWLCSMLGFDKVMETFKQVRGE